MDLPRTSREQPDAYGERPPSAAVELPEIRQRINVEARGQTVDGGAELIGRSPAIAALRERVRDVGQRASGPRVPPVLIEGETGTGKGLLARAIHRASSRASRPLIDVNCAAIPETLMESELFGHERGAFTDAREARAGLFQAAHGGTLFLDELGLLPQTLQGKLLKVVEERTVRRLGSTRSEPVDAWVIAATSEDLQAAMRAGRMREDLYHRLAVLTLRLPPLRERGDDVLLLAEHFLARACADYRRPAKTLAADAREALAAYAWPGNVRELANVMERVALLTDGTRVAARMLGLPERAETVLGTPPALRETLSTVEKERLSAALAEAGGNLSRAAARLGLPRNTLRYRLERHELLAEPARTPKRAAAPRSTARPDRPASQPPAPAVSLADLRWERRHVALLAASITATELPGGAARALEIVVDKGQSFGGRVEDLSPSGLTAVFGIEPVEDAPRLAALAALAAAKAAERARRADAAPPALRVAIHVQPAEVGRLGGTLLVDAGSKRAATAVLDELLAQAHPESVLVSDAAAPFLERRFELEAAAATGYRLTGDERVGLRVGGDVTPMVGRNHELELLRRLLSEAGTGRGQVVGVAGEAGIGKSRLVSELRRGLYGGAVLALEAQCFSQGSSIPYFPIRELLRRLFGVAEGDEPAAAAEKIRAGVRAMDGDADTFAPWILHLLGLASAQVPAELSPEAVQARTFAVLRTLAVQASRRTPLLVVVEDAHWIDRTSEDLLVSLAEAIAGERVLLLLTYRAGYRPPWIESPHASQISLSPLSADESLAVVRAVLRAEEVRAELAQSILDRAEGNPLFLEELARTAAAGTGGGAVPATLEAALAGRIQGLPEHVRRLVQTASVLGRHFSPALLERVWPGPGEAEPEMRELKRLHLVQERVRLDGPLYSFRHALIQEAAYQSVAPAERQRVHVAAARALEELHVDRPEAECELIAHHYLRGGEPAQALRYLELSNRKAARASAMPEARGYLLQALEALDGLPDTPDRRRRTIALLVDQALVMTLLFRFDEYGDLLRRHEAAALALDDTGLRGAFLACRGVCEWGVGHFDRAIASFAEAGRLCEAAGHVAGAALAHSARQWAHLYKGEYQAVLDLLPSVRRVLEKSFIPRWEAYALGAAARACTYLGRWDAALGYAREELALAERFADDSLVSHAALTLALAEGTWGELAGAVEHGELALRKAPTPADRMWARAILAWAWCRAGEPARGVEALEAVVARSRAVRWQAGEFYAVWLGEALVDLGEHERARRTLAECLDVAEEHGMAYLVGSVRRLLGEVARAEGTPEAAGHFEAGLRVLAAVRAQNELALAHAGYGRLLAAQGLRDRAREHLGRALAILDRLGTRREPERVRTELARLEAG